MRERIPWPSQRAQWSALFSILLILTSASSIGSPASLAARFSVIFLFFYFPIAWAWNHEFTIPGRGSSDDS
jgi:hypothetical protein